MSSLISLSPSALASQKNLKIVNIDLNKAMTRYVDTGKGFIGMGTFRINRNAFKLVMKGELTTNGIAVNEFNKIANYSIGIQLDEEKDLEAFEKLNNMLAEFLEDAFPNSEEWDLNRIVKDDRVYLKLKIDGKKNFQFNSNIKLTPKNLSDSGLFRGQKVEVTAEIAPYFNFEDKKAGLSISPRIIKFDVDDEVEEPVSKKVRT